MNRVPEPELMLDEEQARAYAQADFESAHSLYPPLFAETFPNRPAKALVLDLGCGPCDVTIRFARANPGYKFHAVDGSAAMLKYAGERIARDADLAGRIRLIEGYIPGAPIPEKAYDAMYRLSGQTLTPVIDVDGQILADFGARELAEFWKNLQQDRS